MRVIHLLLTLALLPFEIAAQQTATFAQYAFNGLAINPGYAGSHDLLSVSAISRFQNSGLEGAPYTQTFAIHGPLPMESLAAGAMFIRDQIGPINQTGAHGVLAYRLFTNSSNTQYVSFGVQVGVINYNANYSELAIFNPSDPSFASDLRQSRFNVGAGVYYRTDQIFAGIAVPHMMNNVFDRGKAYQTIHQSTPLIVHGGYLMYINPVLKFKPNFMFKMMDGRPSELDLNGSLLIDDLLWVGASYKLPSGLNLLTEFQINDQLLFGYSYALTRGALRQTDLGTHEILINYRFKFFNYGVVSPRYF